MNVALHLEQLKIKRLPGQEAKPGILVKISGPNMGNAQTDRVEELDEPLLDQERDRAPNVKIQDARGKKKIDREFILNRLHGKKPRLTPAEIVSSKMAPGDDTDKLNVEETRLLVDMTEPVIEADTEDSIFRVNPKSISQTVADEHPPAGEVVFKRKKPVAKTKAAVPIEPNEEEEEKKRADAIKPKKPRKIIVDNRPQWRDLLRMKIGSHTIADRLPVDREKIIMETSPYYMNNRKLFIKQIGDLFGSKYRKEIADSEELMSCKDNSKSHDFKLLTHQKIVRDYLNLYTPYRGLLLFHGLGSGKTCTAIAIAEGLKSRKKIYILTPASLKMNFFSQMKKCGDDLYRKKQFWEFVSIEGKPDYVRVLSTILQLPEDHVIKNRGAWLVNVKKPSNFTDLDTRDQEAIDEQLNIMIRSKYIDINYNGLNKSKMKLLTGDYSHNPFDNSVVLIDEAHNFVSRIVNKIPKKAAKSGAKSPDSIMLKLYEYLMSAKNARIVLMTGTPIINYPNEIGILFNIIRGYIKTWTFPVRVQTTGAVNRDTILEMFEEEGLNTYDYVEYGGNKLVITRNPFGFINSEKGVKKRGTTAAAKRRGGAKTKKAQSTKSHRRTKKREITKTDYKLKNDMIVTTQVLDDLEILPEESEFLEHYKKGYTGDNEPHQGGDNSNQLYSTESLASVDLIMGGAGEFDKYGGVHLDDTGNMTDDVFVSRVIDILAKNGIEVIQGAIEVVNNKSLPDDSDTFIEKFIEPGAKKMKNENVFKRRILGLTSYFRSAQETLLPNYILNEEGGIFHIVQTPMSTYQFSLYERIRKEEADKEKTARKQQNKKASATNPEELFKVASSYRIFSRAACNFAFPDPPGRPLPDRISGSGNDEIDESEYDAVPLQQRNAVNEIEIMAEGEDQDQLAVAASQEDARISSYQERIDSAMKFLEYNVETPREQEYLTREALDTYSPKFLAILDNISDEDNHGLHLLYSQFRTIEGIGILKLILEANGYAQFKIQKRTGAASSDSWEILKNPDDEDKPKFVLYTGTESAEEKEIVRNIYNGDWEYIPTELAEELRKKNPNNLYGEIIKILMITASGAEGINLKNTRFVHIVEPYWHMVRTEQVIGRARRICSHEELPEEERNIKVFLYLSTLPESLKEDKAEFTKHIELMNRDISKLDSKHSVTTDELLFEAATIKDNINRQILTAIKETAIDCTLYAGSSSSENLVCYGFGKVSSNQFASYPTLGQDETEKDELNVRKQRVEFGNVVINKVKYAWNKENNELFDYESFQRAKKSGEDLIYIGRLVRDGPKRAHIDTAVRRI